MNKSFLGEQNCSLGEQKCSLGNQKCCLGEQKCSLGEQNCSLDQMYVSMANIFDLQPRIIFKIIRIMMLGRLRLIQAVGLNIHLITNQ